MLYSRHVVVEDDAGPHEHVAVNASRVEGDVQVHLAVGGREIKQPRALPHVQPALIPQHLHNGPHL